MPIRSKAGRLVGRSVMHGTRFQFPSDGIVYTMPPEVTIPTIEILVVVVE